MTETPALDLIRKGWTQKISARNNDGLPVHPEDNRAVCWCSIGAINRAYADFSGRNWALEKLSLVIDDINIMGWNDQPFRTHDQVIKVFEQAGV